MPKIKNNSQSDLRQKLGIKETTLNHGGMGPIKSVLLGMSDTTARFFKDELESHADTLKVLSHTVPIFHGWSGQLTNCNPDIFLIYIESIRFDTNNPKSELLNGLYAIKRDPTFAKVRIALITKLPDSDPFLAKLAVVSHDIFKVNPQNNQIDIITLVDQLTRPENIQNVTPFLSNGNPKADLDPDSLVKPSNFVDSNAVQRANNLQKSLDLITQRNKELEKKAALPMVPKADYMDLLKRVSLIVNDGIDDDRVKEIFQNVIDKNNKLITENNKKDQVIRKQNNLINDLNSSQKNNGNSNEVKLLLSRLKAAEAQLNQGSTRFKQSAPPDFSGPRNSRPGSPRERNDRVGPWANGEHIPGDQRNNLKSKRPRSPQRNPAKGRAIILGTIFLLIFIGIVSIFFIKNRSNNSANQNTNVQTAQTSNNDHPSFKSLISSGDYDQAAEYYPERAVEAENKMLANGELDDKATFAAKILKYSKADAIKYDNYYFEAKYKKVVNLLDNSSDENLTNLSDARRAMAAYSLMKNGEVKRAQDEAAPLHNKDLNTKIKLYKTFADSNAKLRKRINSGELSGTQKKKAQDLIRKNQSYMNKI